MANPEHLAMLKQGVEAWNEWRRHNPGIEPNLDKADLRGMALRDADLRGVGLLGANPSGANMVRANLYAADLRYASLFKADLHMANLRDADLRGAKVSGADLSGADLRGADLSGADLRGASLCEADLSVAMLIQADLRKANLQDAYAKYCQFSECDLTESTLTGTKLYATARDNWIINDVQCGYIFWDLRGRIRSPADRDFAPGEFERLYRSLPTIEYIFQNRMTPLDPLIMDRVVQDIDQRNPEFGIQIDSISARGLTPSIKFTVQQEEQKESALAEVTKMYEAKLQEFAGRLDEARAFIQLLIDRPNPVYIGNATAQYLAIGGSTINIDQHVEYITSLRDTVAAMPEDSPAFATVAKRTALDIIGGALKDVAKGQVKEAAKQIYELGKDLGPVIVNTAAHAFFRSCIGL